MKPLSDQRSTPEFAEVPPPDDGTSMFRSSWLLVAIPVCLVLGGVELARALGGHGRAWVYAVEWPAFAVWFYYIYSKLKQNEPIFKPYRPEDYPVDDDQR